EVTVPRDEPPHLPINAEPLYRTSGAPYEPIGDPMLAEVGPGAWTARPDEPDLDHHGLPKIMPLAKAPEFGVSGNDPDPRGKDLLDADGEVAGVIKDLWVDRGEAMFRYLEAEVPANGGGTRRVLVPMAFARIRPTGVTVKALLAHQFANVPALKADDRVTLLEEEKVTAYYGAGTLYAKPDRAEPLI
ncbi:MAG: PRC-barrel domain-containing protein, partial [Burkholderiales bacterium]|nr:PRC-barrel domain-containing protein [Burkholderiales bacterium]